MTLTVVGCGSANPTRKYHPSCQTLTLRGKTMMIDCGEGTQMRLAQYGLGLNRIGHIFITHHHGDHCFGLPGLLNTMGLLGRTSQLHIHAPKELKPFVDMVMETFCHEMDYDVIFHTVDTRAHALIHQDRSLEVWSLPLSHSVPCCGYLFREKPTLPHIRRGAIETYDIPFSQINNIKAGADFQTTDGRLIPNAALTEPAERPRSFAYCSDTSYKPELAELIHGVDLLYHEATFAKDDAVRARLTRHSTTEQAAQIARRADVRRLLIGHYTARLKDEAAHLKEAQAVFPDTVFGYEGLTVNI